MSKNPWSRAAKAKQTIAEGNGRAPVKPSLATLTKGKPKPKLTLGAALGIKQPEPERPYQAPKPRVKEDFTVNGVLFSGAEMTGEDTKGYRDGIFRPIGTVDVTNGDQTYTFHNRHGSWLHDVWQGDRLAEPARVAEWLGVIMSQLEMSRALSERFERELKKQGIPTTHQQRAQVEAKAAAARKRTKQPQEETTTVTPKKPSLLKLRSKK